MDLDAVETIDLRARGRGTGGGSAGEVLVNGTGGHQRMSGAVLPYASVLTRNVVARSPGPARASCSGAS